MPDWLRDRLADAAPVDSGSFRMPAEGADLADALSWPVHDGDFPLWPENEAVFNFFTLCRNRWRHAGVDGAAVGLDMMAVDLVARTTRFRWNHDRMLELLACEGAAIDAWNHERKLAQEARERQ